MKLALILLAIVLVVGALGAVGYILVDELVLSAPGDAVQVATETSSSTAASQGGSQAPKVDVNFNKPVTTSAEVLNSLDYEYTQNKDTIGWLHIPDTKVSASVLQSFDNNYYLRRDERKKDQIYGCYFADYTCNFGARDALSPNTTIYGHSDLKDNPEGPRFSQLFQFTDLTFAQNHPAIYFSTREETMAWQIFAVFYTDLDLDFTRADLSGPKLVELANAAKARSLYDYQVEVTEQDKILTLVTCTIKYGQNEPNVRYCIMAKLMPQDQKPERNPSLTQNPSPVQPVL